MKKILKWAGIGLGALLALIAAAGAVLYWSGGSRLNTAYTIPDDPVEVRTDSAAIAHGRHLAEAVSLCTSCHGDDLGGDVLFDEPPIASVYASNLTSGAGGIGRSAGDADLVRAIRHGVNTEGRALMIMHADAYHHYSAADLGALVGFIRSMPPVDRELPRTRVAPLGRVMVALGLLDTETMPLLPAEVIDHSAPLAEAPLPGTTPAYGKYLVSVGLCTMCHGADMKGGPPIEEGAPPGPDITAYGASAGWSEEQFISTIRTGVTPYGKALNSDYMPWKQFGGMTDQELTAITRYLGSLSDG